MDPLAKVRGFRHVSDSLPGMSGEIALARAGISRPEPTSAAPRARGEARGTPGGGSELQPERIPGGSGHRHAGWEAGANEGGVVTSAARSDGEPATAPPRLTPDLYGGAQSAGLTPSVRPLREAAGRPDQGAA